MTYLLIICYSSFKVGLLLKFQVANSQPLAVAILSVVFQNCSRQHTYTTLCVLILLCPHTTIYVSSCYVCVLILLYMYAHTLGEISSARIVVSVNKHMYVCPHYFKQTLTSFLMNTTWTRRFLQFILGEAARRSVSSSPHSRMVLLYTPTPRILLLSAQKDPLR